MSNGPALTFCVAMVAALPVSAQTARLTEDRAAFSITLNGQQVSITRDGAPCPPACLQPMRAAADVATVGELEVMDFLDLFVGRGRGLLVDVRLPDGFAAGTIPGAVNVPATTLRPSNPYRDDLLNALGVRGGDFSAAFDLVIFADGPASDAAPAAVQSLLEAGYPADKLKFYRGGYAVWQMLGLSVVPGA